MGPVGGLLVLVLVTVMLGVAVGVPLYRHEIGRWLRRVHDRSLRQDRNGIGADRSDLQARYFSPAQGAPPYQPYQDSTSIHAFTRF